MHRFFVLFGNEGFPTFDSKDNPYVKLGIVSAMTFLRGGPVHLSPRWGFRIETIPLLYTYRPAGASIWVRPAMLCTLRASP